MLRMKRWRTPAGEVLVEQAGRFHLLAAGVPRRTWATIESSVDDTLYRESYRVQDGGLWCDFWSERGKGQETTRASLELGGLVELPADDAAEQDALAALRQKEEDQAARWKAAADVDARRLASFRMALPSAPSELRFVFSYDGADCVVRGPDGAVLWRDGTWPYRGKDLFRELKAVLAEAWPGRVVHFEVDVKDADFLRFNPD
jgi:hypothetical protein